MYGLQVLGSGVTPVSSAAGFERIGEAGARAGAGDGVGAGAGGFVIDAGFEPVGDSCVVAWVDAGGVGATGGVGNGQGVPGLIGISPQMIGPEPPVDPAPGEGAGEGAGGGGGGDSWART